ncbi:MAG: tetratricopeptide repeat protein [Cytophagales bacterium]|nr:tetratricopeptide repeat protein [Cytophagales bacterium]
MLRYKAIIIVSGILIVALLFNLPKGIIKAEDKKLATTTSNKKEETATPESSHNQPMSASEVALIQGMKARYIREVSTPKKILLLDSLSLLFEVFNKYDSSAYYAEVKAQLSPSYSTWVQAGEAYYKTFSFAVGTDKAESSAEKAREYFGKVLEKKPSDPEIKSKMAMTYVSSPEPMKGILMLREVLKENPDNRSALFNLGILSMQSGQYDKAIERFERVMQLYPKDGEAVFYLGMSYFQSSEKENAKKYLNLAKSINTDPAILESADGMLKELEKM